MGRDHGSRKNNNYSKRISVTYFLLHISNDTMSTLTITPRTNLHIIFLSTRFNPVQPYGKH